MKKQVKRSLVLVLVLVLLCSLCGCKALDEMRNAQIFPGESGEIVWNGTVYKALPYCEYLFVETVYDPIYLTEEDVPVLLSPVFFQQIFYTSEDGRFLMDPESENAYYCNATDYDAICARLETPFEAEILCYWYSEYSDDYFDYEYKAYTLTNEQMAAISQVTETVEPKAMEKEFLLDYDWSVVLDGCSADMLLRRSDMEIAVRGDTYYLVVYADVQNLVYTVPASMNDTFAQILRAYTESEDFGWMTDDEFIIQ